MRRTEIVFLLSVCVFAVAFATLTLSEAAKVITWSGGAENTFLPSAGAPRDVDMQRLQRLLERRSLSDREALYYKQVEDSPASEKK